MYSYRNLYAALSIGAMILGLTVFVSAQRRGSGYDPYYGNNEAAVRSAVKSLRNTSRRFEDILDRELDRSRYDGTRREDNLNALAKRFKNAAEDLDDEYEGRGSRRSSSDEARRVVQYGSQLDQALSRSRLAYNNYSLQSSWAAIERDLSTIARAYNIRYSGAYGRARNDRGPYGRDRGYGGNRGPVYDRGRSTRNLRATVVNLKNNARRLENRIDNLDDRDRWGRRSGNDRLEDLSDRFSRAADRLEREYDDRRDYNDSYDEVRNVLSIGEQLDREISRARVDRSIRSDWNRIESDLRVLASTYNLRYSGSGGGYGIGDIIRDWPF